MIDLIQHDRLCDDLSCILHQQFQNGILCSGQPEFYALDCYLVGSQIQTQVPHSNHLRGNYVKYGIRSIPTLLFFKNGELVDRLVGAAPKAGIAAKIDALL